MILSGAMRSSKEQSESNVFGMNEIERAFIDCLRCGSNSIVPENVEKLGAVAAAHRIITNSLAAMPWQIRRKEGEKRFEEEHALSKVLKTRANQYMSPFIAEKTIFSYAFWRGVGYGYIERGKRGEITGIIPLPITPEITYNRSDGTRWYKFTIPDSLPYAEGLSKSFTESQLLIYRFETYDGCSGRGMLDIARETMDTDMKALTYGNKFYSNGARPSGIIEVAGELNSDKRELLKEEFNKKYSGDNAFKVAVLDLGMKYTQLGISQQDSQYIQAREFTVDEVSRYTGVPAYMLQAGKQSYQSNEQQQLDFVVNTLTPHLVQIEQEWKYKLYSEKELSDGWYLKKNVASLLRGTHEARAKYYQTMIGISAMNADEVRADEDKSPLPDSLGQKFWMSKNFAPVDDPTAFNKGGAGKE